MDASTRSKPVDWKTFWMALLFFWLFMMGEVFDEVRHGHENLFIWVPTVFWLGTAAFCLAVVHWA